MTNQPICQSCAMPMKPDEYGANKDGSPNSEYCGYCFDKGEFTGAETLEQMIDICVPHMAGPESGMTEAEARAMLEATLPQLKRWKKA